MDELDLFRYYRRGVAAPSADERRRASVRLASVLDEAVGRAQPARLRHDSLRRRLVAFAAAALVVVAGTASAFGSVRDFLLDRGFIGLPPNEAMPSSPESGELILFYWGPLAGTDTGGKSRFWLYADGRLISLRAGVRPEGANQFSTGYLEQRLTPEGAELLRSEIVSIGLIGDEDDGAYAYQRANDADDFAIGGEPVSRETTTPLPDYTLNFKVRDGDQMYRISRVGDLERLGAQLADPASSLPASAWFDREIRAYVPSRFEIVYGPWQPTATLSGILTLLPASAEELLRANQAKRERERAWVGTPGQGPVPADWFHFSVTTEEARALKVALVAAGLDDGRPDASAAAWELAYTVDAPAWAPREGPVGISFNPILPHGEATCGPCG